jgi:hypothetical protein
MQYRICGSIAEEYTWSSFLDIVNIGHMHSTLEYTEKKMVRNLTHWGNTEAYWTLHRQSFSIYIRACWLYSLFVWILLTAAYLSAKDLSILHVFRVIHLSVWCSTSLCFNRLRFLYSTKRSFYSYWGNFGCSNSCWFHTFIRCCGYSSNSSYYSSAVLVSYKLLIYIFIKCSGYSTGSLYIHQPFCYSITC